MSLTAASADSLVWNWPDVCPELQPGTVHVWLADLNESADKLEQYKTYLESTELSRAYRYAYDETRERYIIARGILKEIIAMYTQRHASEVRFCLGRQGKPYLDNDDHPRLSFNSTDSRHIALYALCWSSEVGIDVELRDRKVRHNLIAKRKLTNIEYEHYLNHEDEQDRRETFLSMWTRKESFGKAKGVGVYYKMNRVNLLGENETATAQIICPDGLPWEITPIFPTKDIIACVSTAGIGWKYQGYRYSHQSSGRGLLRQSN